MREGLICGPSRKSCRGGSVVAGLAIVKAIAAAHGGSVALSTDATRSADVVLTLPATTAPATGVATGAARSPSPA
jgi:K+-sensing histidine kinase KdpD